MSTEPKQGRAGIDDIATVQLPSMERIRAFVVVAEELHFGRAAARLHLTQPPLSRQIMLLEQEVGVPLLDRSGRAVTVTPAGRVFLAEARRILRLAEESTLAVRRIPTGTGGTLAVGFTAVSVHGYVRSFLRRAAAELPHVDLVLRELVTADQVEAIASGDIDLGFVRPPVNRAWPSSLSQRPRCTRTASPSSLSPMASRLPSNWRRPGAPTPTTPPSPGRWRCCPGRDYGVPWLRGPEPGHERLIRARLGFVVAECQDEAMRTRRFDVVVAASPGGRVVIVVPFDPDEAWGVKAVHHVNGTVGGQRVRVTLTPGEGGWGFAYGPERAQELGLEAGRQVAVELTPEGPQRADLAEDIANALAANPAAGAFFDTLAQFYRKGYLRYIDATTRRPDVRAARIAEVTDLLAAGVKERPRP